MAIRLKELISFDMSSPARAASCIRRFELNVRKLAEDIAAQKADRWAPVKVDAGANYLANAGEFILAGNGATIFLPEPTPTLGGIGIAVAVPSGTASIQCISGAAVVRSASSVTYSSATSTRFICSGDGWF